MSKLKCSSLMIPDLVWFLTLHFFSYGEEDALDLITSFIYHFTGQTWWIDYIMQNQQ